jgi:predicted 3-demethylubiquinone-9 3-methyltransferase (glyoxalase superfamily)
LATHPKITHNFFNGAKSEQTFKRKALPSLSRHGRVFTLLPSTSPAHAAMPFSKKVEVWSAVKEALKGIKRMSKVRTCLWFAKDAKEAVVSLLSNSRIDHVLRSPGPWPGGDTGEVILISFTLGGQSYQALNGGNSADYGTAASITVECADQAEVDRLWTALTANGGKEIFCGWLRDRWGVPWQIVPEVLPRLLADPDPAVSSRAFMAMQGMVKLDVAALEKAAGG